VLELQGLLPPLPHLGRPGDLRADDRVRAARPVAAEAAPVRKAERAVPAPQRFNPLQLAPYLGAYKGPPRTPCTPRKCTISLKSRVAPKG